MSPECWDLVDDGRSRETDRLDYFFTPGVETEASAHRRGSSVADGGSAVVQAYPAGRRWPFLQDRLRRPQGCSVPGDAPPNVHQHERNKHAL